MKTYTNAYMYLFKWLAVCHAFKIDRNAIQVTGVKSVRKNIKPIFKRPSSDWNKQTIFVGLMWLTLHVLDFCVNILTGQKRNVTKLKLLRPVNMTGYSPISKVTVEIGMIRNKIITPV